MERAGFLAHARTSGFRRRVEVARDAVTQWLRESRQPYVAFSGGKDSTAMLHLVRKQAPDTPAMFGDAEYQLPETDELVAATPNVYRVAMRVRHADWFTSWSDGPDGLPADTEWVPNDARGQWAHQHGHDGVAVGIRADESAQRRTVIRIRGMLSWNKTRSLWVSWPLAHWTVHDVWAYLVSRDVPYNRAYDRLVEIGVPLRDARLGAFAEERVLSYGQMGWLRMGWPAEYERFAARFPMAKRFT